MSSNVKVDKIWPRLFTTSYIEMMDGEVKIFPSLKIDHISEYTPGHGVVIDDLNLDLSRFVDCVSNQTVGGIKTFTSIPMLPSTTPTNDNHAVRKKYVDDLIGGDPVTPVLPGSLPIGSIISWAGDWHFPPAGFLLCNGAEYSTSEYAALHAVIAYWFGGSGDVFNVPDLRTRVPMGLKPADSNFDTLGRSGGSASHQLSEAEMPAHAHNTDARKYSAVEAQHKEGGGQLKGPYLRDSGFSALAQSKGQGIPHNNLPPYLVLNFIIRYI